MQCLLQHINFRFLQRGKEWFEDCYEKSLHDQERHEKSKQAIIVHLLMAEIMHTTASKETEIQCRGRYLSNKQWKSATHCNCSKLTLVWKEIRQVRGEKLTTKDYETLLIPDVLCCRSREDERHSVLHYNYPLLRDDSFVHCQRQDNGTHALAPHLGKESAVVCVPAGTESKYDK